MPTVVQQLSVNNSNAGGGFYSQGGQFYYVRGLGLIRDTNDIGDVIVGSQNGVPVRVRDIGEVTIGHAPRLGEFGFNKTDDAVEGVIMMRRGEQTQNVLKGVEAKTQQLNEQILPPDIKVRPYYDRSDLVQLTIDTVEHNLLLGMALVLIVLMFFLVSLRAAVIVALTIPLSLLFSFIFLHARGRRRQPAFDRRHRFRNPHRRNPGDGGKHLPRAGRARRTELQPEGSDPGGGEGCGPAHLLFRRGDYRRISAHLCAQRALGKTVPAHGGHGVHRAGRRADSHADVRAGDVLPTGSKRACTSG